MAGKPLQWTNYICNKDLATGSPLSTTIPELFLLEMDKIILITIIIRHVIKWYTYIDVDLYIAVNENVKSDEIII